jgi:flagellar basal-body rod modification protein FlgD
MAVTASSAVSSSISTGGVQIDKQLDQDAFLKLLMTELSNQDPMNPMEDKDFIAQLAQFSNLEQMQTLNKSFDAFAKSQLVAQGTGLIGRSIKAVDPVTGEYIDGKVDGIEFNSGTMYLKVGDKYVQPEMIASVY